MTALGRSVQSTKKPPLPVLLPAGVIKGDGSSDRLASNTPYRLTIALTAQPDAMYPN